MFLLLVVYSIIGSPILVLTASTHSAVSGEASTPKTFGPLPACCQLCKVVTNIGSVDTNGHQGRPNAQVMLMLGLQPD
jgi:hypothetical protein